MTSAQHLTFINSHSAVDVKQGFCWPAFFFGSFWAAAKRMWFPYFFALFAIETGLWFLAGYAQASQSFGLLLLDLVVTTAFAVMRGRQGHRWQAASLLSRGYQACR
jgi:hypothetical protein